MARGAEGKYGSDVARALESSAERDASEMDGEVPPDRADVVIDDIAPKEPAAADSPDGVTYRPIAGYYARFGSVILTSQSLQPDRSKLYEHVRTALKADSRIAVLKDTKARPEWIYQLKTYPIHGDIESVISGTDTVRALLLSEAFVFTVRVPVRNQPKFKNTDDVPSDTYYVAWDGMVLVVLWERDLNLHVSPRSGGHVVVDVLKDVAEKAGFQLMVQACNPACTNIFAHRVLEIEQYDPSDHRGCHVSGSNQKLRDLLVHAGVNGDGQMVAEQIIRTFGFKMRQFTQLKNVTLRARLLESFIGRQCTALLALRYTRIGRSHTRLRTRAGSLWRNRHEGIRLRTMLAGLWLGLSNLELLRREASDRLINFETNITKGKVDELFDQDTANDKAAMSSMDVSFVQAALEQTADRSDNKVLAWVTALGAVLALIGVVLSQILS